jgi:GNAT superfamily N-acetyltransferase
MATVLVRDARAADAHAIAAVWATAMPHLVRSTVRAAADLRADEDLGRTRLVGVIDGHVVGTATAREVGVEEVFLTVEVHPDYISRGVGTALLNAVAAGFPRTTRLTAVCHDDAIALAFAVRNGFLPEGEIRLSRVEPAAVDSAGPVPEGLRAVTLDALPDLELLLATHNEAADDDPSGLSRRLDLAEFRADWWDSPDNAPDLSWALLDEGSAGTVVASFSGLQVDRARRRAWSAMTATRRSYRGRGLATWVKRRTLSSAAAAGVVEAWTASDVTNEPMLAVNDALGYRPHVQHIRVSRRLPH